MTPPSYRSRQEAFNQVAEHLLKQGKKAMYGGSCQYRTDDGCKCAVGIFIPDDKYDYYLEGAIAFSPRVLRAAHIPIEDGTFYRELQKIHDRNDPHTWPKKLYELAELFNLSTHKLDAAVERYGTPCP